MIYSKMLSLHKLSIRPTINNTRFHVHDQRINKPLSLTTLCNFQHKFSDSLNVFPQFLNQNSSVLKSRLAAGGSKRAPGELDSEDCEIQQLPEGLNPEMMPKHIAVIMDGNRRWAKNRGFPGQFGHRAGGKSMKQLVWNCMKLGIKVVTVFAFSTENWTRPKDQVDFLMSLFEEVIESDLDELMGYGLRISFVGNRKQLPKSLEKLVSSSAEQSMGNKVTHLVVALNYSGRYDITEATKEIASKVRDGILQVEDINESLFEQHLETNGIEFPNPDLLIRTSGELRISNFMLWQLAYTEMLFVDKLFPDFGEADLVEALTVYQQRERRFGGRK